MSTLCQFCGAEVVWATTEKGKAMPLNAEPVEHGNIWLEERSYPVYSRGPLVREEIVLTAVFDLPEQDRMTRQSVNQYRRHVCTSGKARKEQ